MLPCYTYPQLEPCSPCSHLARAYNELRYSGSGANYTSYAIKMANEKTYKFNPYSKLINQMYHES